MFDVLRKTLVLDFGKFVAAPSATWLLSNMGAKVVKIEPVGGSPDREPFRISDELDGAGFLQLHSNKRSVCLNHETPQGRAVLERLVRACDVVVCGAPASTLQRQGIDYETLSKINTKLIYLNVSAFTSKGPRANDIGFDGIGQVMGGAAYMSGFGDTPTRSFCSWVDVTTGIYSAFAIACALLDRERSGKGFGLPTRPTRRRSFRDPCRRTSRSVATGGTRHAGTSSTGSSEARSTIFPRRTRPPARNRPCARPTPSVTTVTVAPTTPVSRACERSRRTTAAIFKARRVRAR